MPEYNGKQAPRWAVIHMTNKDRAMKALQEENERLRQALGEPLRGQQGMEIRLGGSTMRFDSEEKMAVEFSNMTAGSYPGRVSVVRKEVDGRIFLEISSIMGGIALSPKVSNVFELEVVDAWTKMPVREDKTKTKGKKGKS